MSSVIGKSLKIAIFGESHGSHVGVTIDGFPAGIFYDEKFILNELKRRSPSNFTNVTTRNEPDMPRIISGIYENYTTGTPITAIFENLSIRRNDYSLFKNIPRPSHGDYTAKARYGDTYDGSGGGHMSGRLTLPMVFAGALAKYALNLMNISICSHLSKIDNISDISPDYASFDNKWYNQVLQNPLPVISKEICDEMQSLLSGVRDSGNSVAGFVECFIYGLPAGIGSPMFDNVESRLSALLFAIPALKELSFGRSVEGVHGNEYNDCYTAVDNRILTKSNHCGGILGGITTGMPIVFSAGFKPTPSIYMAQNTLNIETMKECELVIKGRHDPCVAIRALAAVEACSGICVLDLLISEGKYVKN